MIDQVFVPGLALGHAVHSAARDGFAFVPRALMEAFRRELQREVRTCAFRRVPEEIGPVRQETEECVIPTPMHGYPLLATLSRVLVARPEKRASDFRPGVLATDGRLRAALQGGGIGDHPASGRQTVRAAGGGVYHQGLGAILRPRKQEGAGNGVVGGHPGKPGVAPRPRVGGR